MEKKTKEKKPPAKKWVYILTRVGVWVGVAGLGVGAGFGLAKFLKPDTTQYIVDELTVDMDSALASYEKAKKAGDYTSMRPDEIVNVAYHLFSQEESNHTMGVGYTLAAIVRQEIQSRTVKDGKRYFEESNSVGIVNLYDRMYMEGDQTLTYWGDNPDYGSHPEKSYSNDEYRSLMGRYISQGLIYILTPKTVLLDKETASGDPPTSIGITNEGFQIEIELDPQLGTSNYQKQMQTISSLKYKPTFEFCHLTFYLDKELNLIKFVTHEKYLATTSGGISSTAEGSLITLYYHEAPSFGFPAKDAKLPDYPASLE